MFKKTLFWIGIILGIGWVFIDSEGWGLILLLCPWANWGAWFKIIGIILLFGIGWLPIGLVVDYVQKKFRLEDEKIITVIVVCVMGLLLFDRFVPKSWRLHSIPNDNIEFVIEQGPWYPLLTAEEKNSHKIKYDDSVIEMFDKENKRLEQYGCEGVHWDENNVLYGTYRADPEKPRIPFYLGTVKKINGKVVANFPKGTAFRGRWRGGSTYGNRWYLEIRLPFSEKDLRLRTVSLPDGKKIVVTTGMPPE
jgi:hypothetical protein